MKLLLVLLLMTFSMQAAITGKWQATFNGGGTTREISLFLQASGDAVTGYMLSNNGYEPLSEGKLTGDTLSFTVVRDRFGQEQRLAYTGRLEGDALLLQMPSFGDRRGPELHMKQLSSEAPGPMPEQPKKISLPKAKPVPYNGLAKTPPMGWNSWNKFANKVTDQLIRETADAMASNGMKDAGYSYVNIDDTWEAGRDTQGNIQTNSKFPDMKALAAYVHGKGLKIGIYSSPGPKTCGGYEGSFQHEEQDAKTYASWDIDFLKYDWCSATQVYDYHSMPAVYARMGEALQATGRQIVYSLCQYGVFHGPQWGASVGGNSWRTTGDISDNWKSMSHIGFDQQVDLAQYAGPGHWNDPDMLEVGNGGMNDTEYRTHMSLWSLLAAPLLAGNDLRSVPPAILQILTNKDVIAIDQDPLGKQATRVSKNGDLEVWARPLSDDAEAVGLFNRGAASAKVSASKADLKIEGNFTTRNVWSHEELGTFPGNFAVEVPSHGVVLLRLQPAK